jgi:hypothetical protein
MSIETTLRALTNIAWQARLDPRVHRFAVNLTAPEERREGKMRALVDELHRRFVLAPDCHRECLLPLTLTPGASLDADDACVFVAAAAMSVGIPCRFVGARYGHSWTCWIQYEAGLLWETIDPLRQKPNREPDEEVLGPTMMETP